MPGVRLSQSRIEALEARKSPCDIRDTELTGFGVRVLSSGSKRFFVHSQHEGRRIWKTGRAGHRHHYGQQTNAVRCRNRLNDRSGSSGKLSSRGKRGCVPARHRKSSPAAASFVPGQRNACGPARPRCGGVPPCRAPAARPRPARVPRRGRGPTCCPGVRLLRGRRPMCAGRGTAYRRRGDSAADPRYPPGATIRGGHSQTAFPGAAALP